MTAAIVDQPAPIATARRPAWDLVIEHVEGRRAALPADVVDLVITDMHLHGVGLHGDYLVAAYVSALEFAANLAADLDAHGVAPDTLVDVRAPNSARLVRVQAMLWDHVRMIVQLRGLIEERSS